MTLIQKLSASVAILLSTSLLLSGATAETNAHTDRDAQPRSVTEAAAAGDVGVDKIRFRPRPGTGTGTSVRVTGGSRGAGDEALRLDVLTPDGIGLTTQEQPSLFWFQSKPADAEFELTLLEEGEIEPLVEVKVQKSSKAGVQRMRLANHGVKLAPGVEYQWVVALITDPNNRSSDVVASGVIKRVEISDQLNAEIAKADTAALAGIYAEQGIWYDALSSLTDLIEASPGNQELIAARNDLLSQVDIKIASTQ